MIKYKELSTPLKLSIFVGWIIGTIWLAWAALFIVGYVVG